MNNDLISRRKLLEELSRKTVSGCSMYEPYSKVTNAPDMSAINAIVKAQPVAYDMESVLSELEKESKLYSLSDADCEFAVPLNIAMDIVKRYA